MRVSFLVSFKDDSYLKDQGQVDTFYIVQINVENIMLTLREKEKNTEDYKLENAYSTKSKCIN